MIIDGTKIAEKILKELGKQLVPEKEFAAILVGDDAHRLDERVRQTPERAYDAEFFQSFAAEVGWRLG